MVKAIDDVKTKGIPLENFIFAMGLPGIGFSMSKKLAYYFKTAERFVFYLDYLIESMLGAPKFGVPKMKSRVGGYTYYTEAFVLNAPVPSLLKTSLQEVLLDKDFLECIRKASSFVDTNYWYRQSDSRESWALAGWFLSHELEKIENYVLEENIEIKTTVDPQVKLLIIGSKRISSSDSRSAEEMVHLINLARELNAEVLDFKEWRKKVDSL